jgi:hypothetical protein
MMEMNPFEENTTAVAQVTMDGDEKFIMDLTSERKVQFCSMTPKNEDEEIILYNAMNAPEKRIGDCINMTIEVNHIYCEVVTCVNRESGEESVCPRIVLIDKDGVGYQAVSMGIYSAVKKLMTIKGNPANWKKPVKLKVTQVTKGDRKLLTLNMVK